MTSVPIDRRRETAHVYHYRPDLMSGFLLGVLIFAIGALVLFLRTTEAVRSWIAPLCRRKP
jgi:hypothetical protein